MTDIKWETPPANGRGVGQWDAFAASLQARPGDWALAAEDVSSTFVTSIKKGRIKAFAPAGTFEARGTVVRTGRSKVWVRYVGGSA